MVDKRFKEIIDSKTLSELPYYLSRIDYQIFNYKKQGLSSNCNLMRRKMPERNYVRKRLLKLLTEWEQNGFKSEAIDYNYVLAKDSRQDKEDISILSEKDPDKEEDNENE